MSCDTEASEAREDAIDAALSKPKSVEVDGRKAEAHPIPDMIAADQYLRKRCVQRSGGLGLKLLQVKPPGAV